MSLCGSPGGCSGVAGVVSLAEPLKYFTGQVLRGTVSSAVLCGCLSALQLFQKPSGAHLWVSCHTSCAWRSVTRPCCSGHSKSRCLSSSVSSLPPQEPKLQADLWQMAGLSSVFDTCRRGRCDEVFFTINVYCIRSRGIFDTYDFAANQKEKLQPRAQKSL